MKSIKKHFIFALLLSLLCLTVVGLLSACSGGGSNGNNGKDGVNGKSAYEIWLDEGHTGTQSDFLNWLKGKDGRDGNDGKDGKSAYEVWLDNGHTGTETDFLNWLKGTDGVDGEDGKDGVNGLSAYEIFLKYYPYFTGTEEQWIKGLVNGELRIHKITFKSEIAEDIIKYVFEGYELTDIPPVPEKEGQTSAKWDNIDFKNITADMTVNAVYDMRKYVIFHNEYTDDEDIKITVNYDEAITDIPAISEKVGNDSKWSVTDFSRITEDLQVKAIYETQGLQYVLINQQTQYKVLKGEINPATEELFIPAEYNDKPVTIIDTNGFSENDLLKAVHIPGSITEIRNSAFSYCRKLTRITIPNSVTLIGDRAFYGCSSLTSIVIPDSVTSIEGFVFYGCSSLTSIAMPDSVTHIFNGTFSGCNKLETIYYKGTQDEFQNIYIDEGGNESFTEAMVYYYSETKPTTDGFYWHYDTDGFTPVIWVK